MSVWFHSTILATSLAATVAVGLASASVLTSNDNNRAPKADRLPVAANIVATNSVTIETRENGVSVLRRVPLVDLN